MEASVYAGDGVGDCCGIGDVASYQGGGGRQIGAVAGGQVIQHTHAVAASGEGIAQVGADEAGAPGDQKGAHTVMSGVGSGPSRRRFERSSTCWLILSKVMVPVRKFREGRCHVVGRVPGSQIATGAECRGRS